MHRKPLKGLALVLTAGLALSACSSSSEEEATAALDTVSIMAPFLEPQPPEQGDTMQTKLEEITGKKLDINWVPNADYEEKTNITLAGDDLPHVMVIQGKTPGFVKNATAGAFWELSDYLDEYPNLITENPDIERNASINGDVYGVYRHATPCGRPSSCARTGWRTWAWRHPPRWMTCMRWQRPSRRRIPTATE